MDGAAKNRDLKFWLAWSATLKGGPGRLAKIVNYFPDLATAWRASAAELRACGLEENICQQIVILRSQISPEAEEEKIIKEKIATVLITEKNYPARLKQIYHPPPLIYYRGSLDSLNNFCLAVVGTRKPSPYGRQATEEIVGQLARENITIISGLALGIDALAHEVTLKNQGRTAAVLGSSLDTPNIYPSANRYLAKKIMDSGGAVISEFPLGTPPAKFTFPMRNRIVSGLASGTLVVEAPESSGALITAKYALEQNREVFAIPGSIFSHNSAGANNLIKQGAKLVSRAGDILEEFNLGQISESLGPKKEIQPQNPEEEIILKIINREPTHIDKIAKLSKLRISALTSTMTLLEIRGVIKDLGGKNYIKK